MIGGTNTAEILWFGERHFPSVLSNGKADLGLDGRAPRYTRGRSGGCDSPILRTFLTLTARPWREAHDIKAEMLQDRAALKSKTYSPFARPSVARNRSFSASFPQRETKARDLVELQGRLRPKVKESVYA